MDPRLRPAAPGDEHRIRELIVDLATYERAADRVRASVGQLREALFGAQPTAYALVAESGGAIVGFALYVVNFSTWEGRPGIYLEDLFVTPEHRGTGLGRALLAALAEIAVQRGYGRVDWAVLDWNAPSLAFYRRLGAVPLEEWTVHRLDGDALAAVAASASTGFGQS